MNREALTFPASKDAPGQGTTAGGGRVQASYKGKEQATSGHSLTVTLTYPSLAGSHVLPTNPSCHRPLEPPSS